MQRVNMSEAPGSYHLILNGQSKYYKNFALCTEINWSDLHHLQRLTWLVEKTKERTTEQCSQP